MVAAALAIASALHAVPVGSRGISSSGGALHPVQAEAAGGFVCRPGDPTCCSVPATGGNSCNLPCTLNGALDQIEGDDVSGFFGSGYITGCGNTGTTTCGTWFTRTCGPVAAAATSPSWTCRADPTEYFQCRITRPPACKNALRSSGPDDPVGNECPTQVVAFRACTTSLTPIQPVGGSGSYGLSTNSGSCGGAPTLCAGGGTDGTVAPPATCALSASGTYLNLVCGTGTTGGFPGTADSATLTLGTSSATLSYGMVFIDGVGLLSGTTTAPDGTPGVVEGAVLLTPTSGNCVTPVSALAVSGFLAID